MPHWEIPLPVDSSIRYFKEVIPEKPHGLVKKILEIEYKRASFTYQGHSLFDNFKADTIFFIPEIIKSLEIEILLRIGLRIRYLFPIEGISFDELKDLLFEKLYKKILSEFKMTDLAYIINFEKKPYQFHLELGPLKKEEVKQRFSFEKDLPEISLLIDIDCAQYEIEGQKNKIEKFISEGYTNIEKIKNEIKKGIEE